MKEMLMQEARLLEKCGHEIHTNWYSIDCDGVSGQRSRTYKTVDELNASYQVTAECAEGPFSFEIVHKDDMVETANSAGGWDVM